MPKMDVSMTKDEVDEFLKGPFIARISTIDKDGYPMVHPMWFIYEEGLVFFTTPKYAVKLQNIKRNPRVAVAIDIAGEETK
jgi:nitroimidazol reductase NimA-like FMN-containing flavoprotein (pyridoxamine 5'-phosphate oxidase superfamily)